MARTRPVVAILAGILLLSACSSASPSSTPTSGGGGGGGGGASAATVPSGGGIGGGGLRAPCSLLTQAQVAAAVGYAVEAGTDVDNPGHTCTWTYTDPQDVLTTVAASVDVNINQSTFTRICSATSNSTLGITITQLGGVGDAACTVTAGPVVTTTLQKNGQGYGVDFFASGNAQSKFNPASIAALEKALAVEVAANL